MKADCPQSGFVRVEREGVSLLQAPGLRRPGVVHGFSTRLGGVSAPPFDSLNLGLGRGDREDAVRENFRRFCRAVGAEEDRMVCSRQVHGCVVREVTQADAGKGLDAPRDYEADGLITDQPGLPLVIFSADCIPVLLYDPVRSAIGACHAGWRGTALGIAAETVRRMTDVYGTNGADLICAIGPGISRCCFETREEVPRAMREALGEEAEPFITPGKDEEHYYVNLKGLNRRFLERAGVPAARIFTAEECTACDLTTFYSHRRMGNQRGSLAAMIQLQ